MNIINIYSHLIFIKPWYNVYVKKFVNLSLCFKGMKRDEYILGRLEKSLQADVEEEGSSEEEQDNGEQEKVCIQPGWDVTLTL